MGHIICTHIPMARIVIWPHLNSRETENFSQTMCLRRRGKTLDYKQFSFFFGMSVWLSGHFISNTDDRHLILGELNKNNLGYAH